MPKGNIRQVEQSGGQLSFNRLIEVTVSDQGNGSDNVDFSNFTFEDGRTAISHITILNDGGSNDVWFVFDAGGDTIDTTEKAELPTSYNGKAYAGSPFNKVGYDGTASSIGLRCASGLSTTVKILIW